MDNPVKLATSGTHKKKKQAVGTVPKSNGKITERQNR